MKRASGLLLLLSLAAAAQAPKRLLQRPALSATQIVFVYAGDLWTVPRAGGTATRLTSGVGLEDNPVFSPDGKLVAFSGEYDGNIDLYTVPVSGGVPQRLTTHPLPDSPLAFTVDGRSILFRSNRESFVGPAQFYTVPVSGGFPARVPLPMGHAAAYSADGSRLAYTPLNPAFDAWKRYRGGRTSKIWLASLADSKVEEIPRENSNDYYPMWAPDGRVFFLSDRGGPFTLYAYEPKTKKLAEAVKNTGFDLKSASLGPGAIVYEQFGSLYLYDLKSGRSAPVPVSIDADLPNVRPYFDKAAPRITSASLSPAGVRAAFEARGEIFTVPAEKGDIRNLTQTPGVADRFPSWSPDGQSIAYLSDESGEYALHIRPQRGQGEVKKIALPPAFYWEAQWSPDGKKMLLRDSNLVLSWVDLETQKITRIDADTYDTPDRDSIDPAWSSDSKWITYTKNLKNHLRALHVYSLESGKAAQISDGLSDARYARFDKDGRHLYFTASTNQGLATGWLDMSSIDRVQSRSVYVVVLRKEDPSPLAPESDDEKPAPAKDEKKEDKKDDAVRIDFEGISQRILALPLPSRNYTRLLAGKTGQVFLVESPLVQPREGEAVQVLHRYDLKTRKTEKMLEGFRAMTLAWNGEKLLYAQGPDRWFIASAAAPVKTGEGALKLDAMEVRVDPMAEWKQMYREAWRIQRDFLYDPNLHGLPLANMKDRYAGFLDGIAHRADLSYLFREMLGEVSVGHLYVQGGALPDVKRIPVGLLGCDYETANGRYRFKRIYDGENWNPQARAPLTQPGVNVKAGEYLISVNGQELRDTDEVYRFFEATSGKSVLLKVGPNPDGTGARDVTVVPIPNEGQLRYLAWIEDNRRKVEQLTQGRIGYVHLPNTSIQGYTNFNRYFFAQVGKQGFVLDERFNGGGFIADYIIDYLRRPLLNYFSTRAGQDFTTPMNAVFGPKAMIVNEYAGSGGDAMPWIFRKLNLGPLVGKRTWGGLVGIFGFPQLIDGGGVTAPNLAFYNLQSDWDVENKGVPPDVEVDLDPAMWRQGRDPQLERAIELVEAELKKNPPPVHKKPGYPNYHRPR